jgi:hypothetical protein
MAIDLENRRFVLACHWAGVKQRQIARDLGIARSTVAKIIHAGMRGLRRFERRRAEVIDEQLAQSIAPKRRCKTCRRQVADGPCAFCRVMEAFRKGTARIPRDGPQDSRRGRIRLGVRLRDPEQRRRYEEVRIFRENLERQYGVNAPARAFKWPPPL